MTTELRNYSSKEKVFILPKPLSLVVLACGAQSSLFGISYGFKVGILGDDLLNSLNATLVPLRHPHTQRCAIFILDKENKKVYELQIFNERYRSWFIGNCIISDGTLIIATLFDPTFLILPYLLKASESKKIVPLEHLLDDEEFPAAFLTDFVKDLSCVAHRKGLEELNAWSYNEVLTLSWLKTKVEALAQVLRNRRGRVSQNFSSTTNTTFPDDGDAYHHLSYGIICEYLCESMVTALRDYLSLPEIENGEKDRSLESVGPPRAKIRSLHPSKENALSKAAKGTKPITSYFRRKSK